MIQTITVPTAFPFDKGVAVVFIDGSVFACLSATAPFSVRPDYGAEISLTAGRGFGSPSGRRFFRLTFYNPTAADISVTFYAGFEAYQLDPSTTSGNVQTQITNAPTYNQGNAVINVAATGYSAAFNGLGVSGKIRKTFYVTNLDGANLVKVVDGTNLVMMTVFPLETKQLSNSGTLKIYNPNAVIVPVEIGEEFYS